MRSIPLALLIVVCAVAACSSPELARTRGGGPGADIGNKGPVLRIHDGADPYAGTPKIIPTKHPPLDGARHAENLSRQ